LDIVCFISEAPSKTIVRDILKLLRYLDALKRDLPLVRGISKWDGRMLLRYSEARKHPCLETLICGPAWSTHLIGIERGLMKARFHMVIARLPPVSPKCDRWTLDESNLPDRQSCMAMGTMRCELDIVCFISETPSNTRARDRRMLLRYSEARKHPLS
jgi:hypothetical protein